MPISLAVILGLIQGVSEFLPVSSSGHLVVFQEFLEPVFAAAKTPLLFDVLVHFATLLVIVIFCWRDIQEMLAFWSPDPALRQRARSLVTLVIIATLPTVAATLLFYDLLRQSFSSVSVAAKGFLITAVLLEFAHRRQIRDAEQPEGEGSLRKDAWPLPSLTQALWIGMAQAIAITPGVSRSGSTIASALITGVNRESAIRFSFLMALPAIGGAMILETKNLVSLPQQQLGVFLLGFCAALISGAAALQLLVMVVRGAKLRYFALYVLTLAICLETLYWAV